MKLHQASFERVISKHSISAELAEKMLQAGLAKAREINQPMVIAIVDEAGHLKAFTRMDGSALISIELAQNKAYTAVTHPWGLSTDQIYQHIKEHPATELSIPQIPRYIVFAGGFVIKIADEIVGAIGVSGGTTEQDIIVAKAALAII